MEEWLSRLNDEIIWIFHHLDLFKKLNTIIANNQQLKKMDNTLIRWMRKAFTVDLVIGICRICDTHEKSGSLVQFLQKLENTKEYLTRERYVNICRKRYLNLADLDLANKEFDDLAGKGKRVFSSDKIDSDIIRITKGEPFKKIKTYRDQYLAHSDKIKKEISITYDELFKAFDIIQEIVNKYNLLIRAVTFSQLAPEMQGYWQEPLTIPWIQDTKK